MEEHAPHLAILVMLVGQVLFMYSIPVRVLRCVLRCWGRWRVRRMSTDEIRALFRSRPEEGAGWPECAAELLDGDESVVGVGFAPRPQHWVFAHQTLPAVFFQRPERVISLLNEEGHRSARHGARSGGSAVQRDTGQGSGAISRRGRTAGDSSSAVRMGRITSGPAGIGIRNAEPRPTTAAAGPDREEVAHYA